MGGGKEKRKEVGGKGREGRGIGKGKGEENGEEKGERGRRKRGRGAPSRIWKDKMKIECQDVRRWVGGGRSRGREGRSSAPSAAVVA